MVANLTDSTVVRETINHMEIPRSFGEIPGWIRSWESNSLWAMLFLSIPFAFWLARNRSRSLEEEERIQEEWKDWGKSMWDVKSWPLFFALSELWTLGAFPWGPWENKSMVDQWQDKTYLRRLLRLGIIPLHIQDGGVSFRTKAHVKISDISPFFRSSEHVQSKKRAYFEFIVPIPNGLSHDETGSPDPSRRNFLHRVRYNHRGYRVAIWGTVPGKGTFSAPPPDDHLALEIGATSHFKLLVAFKSDRVLQPAKGKVPQTLYNFVDEVNTCPLLEFSSKMIVRVEAPHWKGERLDRWVYAIAQECNMKRIWTGHELRDMVRAWFVEMSGADVRYINEQFVDGLEDVVKESSPRRRTFQLV